MLQLLTLPQPCSHQWQPVLCACIVDQLLHSTDTTTLYFSFITLINHIYIHCRGQHGAVAEGTPRQP
jgi:hypothetical protein